MAAGSCIARKMKQGMSSAAAHKACGVKVGDKIRSKGRGRGLGRGQGRGPMGTPYYGNNFEVV